MDEKMEKGLLDIREGFEKEITEGLFPNVDLDPIIDGIRRGMTDVKEGRTVGLEEGLARIQAMWKRGVNSNV